VCSCTSWELLRAQRSKRPFRASSIMIELRFASGTLELRGLSSDAVSVPPGCTWDPRSQCHRAEARAYADVVRALVRGGQPLNDQARGYSELAAGLRVVREPRPYQREALAAWEKARGAGVVVLPTGAGKSQLG